MALQCVSGYKPTDLKECVLVIHDLHLNRREKPLPAVREKYMQHKVFYLIFFLDLVNNDFSF